MDAFWVKPGIVFLRVDTFEASNISHDVEARLRQLGEENVNGLILDLRGNLGGLVNEAVALAGRFLRDGQVVVSQHGRAEQEQVFRAKDAAPGPEVSHGGAGESRVRVGVRDCVGRAAGSRPRLGVGRNHIRQRAGAGAVPHQQGSGAALLLTIAHYYTPSGRLIQRDYRTSSLMEYYTARPKATRRRPRTT